MSSDAAIIIGTTAALHLSKHVVKIVFPVTRKSGVEHFDLSARTEVTTYIASRGSARICGPISASFVGPATADIVVSATATIVPTDPGGWPSNLEQVAHDSSAVNFSISALSPVPVATLQLSEVINTQIKPKPLSGRHPAILFGWDVESSNTSFKGRFEFRVPLEFDGVDWVKPSDWK
jgi:hypothetical protein